MGEKIQQLPIPTSVGHDAIFNANYLEEIPNALSSWGTSRVVLVHSKALHCSTSIVFNLKSTLNSQIVSTINGVGSHSPYSSILEIAHAIQSNNANAVVCIGSGSYSDACKVAVLLAATLPEGFSASDMEALVDEKKGMATPETLKAPNVKLICVPTSLSAGEWTPIGAATNEKGKKQHFFHPSGSPALILLDPEVASTSPQDLWLSSGMRAIDHCVEVLCNPKCHEEAASHEEKGLRSLLKGLSEYREVARGGEREKLLDGIAECQKGSHQAIFGAIVWRIRFGLSHQIGHQLGGVAGVQHGVTSCILLPPVLKSTKGETADVQKKILTIFNETLQWDEQDAGDALTRFAKFLGLPTKLSEVGVTNDEQVNKIAEMTLTDALGAETGGPTLEQVLDILNLAR